LSEKGIGFEKYSLYGEYSVVTKEIARQTTGNYSLN